MNRAAIAINRIFSLAVPIIETPQSP
jgi:hypothetical protein